MKIKIAYCPQIKNFVSKKLIVRGLTLGLLFNSTSILSYANTEIPNRYETLEGECIILDDLMEDNLEEIEIFGNTIQDENNLEDIQFVGDLYVDKNGNPILDKQGRKQYKLTISTSNYKRLYSNAEIVSLFNNMGYSNVKAELSEDGKFKVVNNGGWWNPNKVFKGKPNTEYTFSFITRPNWLYTNGLTLTSNHSEYVKTYRTDDTGEFGFLVSPEIGTTFDFRIYEGNIENADVFEEQLYSIEILLPTQLQKVGVTADKLYWDKENSRYLIKKYINSIFIKDYCSSVGANYNFTSVNNLESLGWVGTEDSPTVELEGYKWKKWDAKTPPCISTYRDSFIRIYDDYFYNNGNELSLSEVQSYLGDKKLYYVLKTPEIIETNITSKFKMPTYDEVTYVFAQTENNINPSLKVTVDRLPQIAKSSVEEAEINSSTYNISLARMYTNMLPESLYKDQLQEQLSEIFSSDIALDKQAVTSNIDLYIKSENILQMSLSTNSITFEDFSGVEDIIKENAVQISINSSLPYSLNAYLPIEIQNSDKSNTMDKQILNVKENSKSNYQTFASTTDKVILKDNCPAGNSLIHGVDIKLSGGIAHEKDVYKTTIKFEVEQK